MARPRGDLTTSLLAAFKELIATGALKPGARLPPERTLAEQFGVSRPSLRQALKAMASIGLVEQRVGSGTHLADSAAGILAEPLKLMILVDSITPEELVEARLIVEPELAARAAERASLTHLEDLSRSIEAMSRSESDRKVRIEQDLAFHRGIFLAAGNRVCNAFFSLVHSSMMGSLGATSQQTPVKETIAYHEAIYQAIYNRQSQAARERMLAHIMNTRRLLDLAARAEEPPKLQIRVAAVKAGRARAETSVT